MPDPQKASHADQSGVHFTSDGEIIEITEDNSQPGKASERYRRWLEQKFGRKTPPHEGAPQASNES